MIFVSILIKLYNKIKSKEVKFFFSSSTDDVDFIRTLYIIIITIRKSTKISFIKI